ncbi:MAG: hypothetical protein AAFU77_11130 [Myxococcota bacterium]
MEDNATTPWSQASDLIDTLEQKSPREACAMVTGLREALRLEEDSVPHDPALAVRLELAAAVYFEIDGRHAEAVGSYNRLLRWYEQLGPVSEAHVDGLVSALGWSVLNEQSQVQRRFDRVIEKAIERLDASDGVKATMREWVRIWRDQAGALQQPVVDYERFAEARSEFEVDEVTLDELESHSLTQIWSTLKEGTDWHETYRKLTVVLGEMGFMHAVAVAEEALSNDAPDPGSFSASLTSAFSTARRQLAS